MYEYIEREAAIADLELYETQVFKSEYALAIAGCRSHIRAIPAADVVPVRRGRDIYYKAKGHCEFKCSLCGVEIGVVEGGELDGGHFNYCPNCGAKMEVEE